MPPARSQVHVLPLEQPVSRIFRSGVSLHSHTEHSAERLAKLPEHLQRMPVVAHFTRKEIERYRAKTGEPPDFSRAYWRGPLSAQSAYDLEATQIARLGLRPLVSLTDHDNLEAGLILQAARPDAAIPVSLEWTVPFEKACFHLGVHNIAAEQAPLLLGRMAEFTRNPAAGSLCALLDELDASPDVLIVLNHPLWDIGEVGSNEIVPFIRRFIGSHGRGIHAFEINGLRSWKENAGVAKLAESLTYPIVSGGDRHGLEPNATLNLTRAESFGDFVREIREERMSEVALMPQYREPLVLRHLLTAWDIVREHPHLAERKRWLSRVVVLCEDGVERPLSNVWTEGAPRWIDPCLRVIGLLASPTLRAPFRVAQTVAGSAML